MAFCALFALAPLLLVVLAVLLGAGKGLFVWRLGDLAVYERISIYGAMAG